LDEAGTIRRARVALHRSQRRRGLPWLLPGGLLGGCSQCRQQRNDERQQDLSHRRFYRIRHLLGKLVLGKRGQPPFQTPAIQRPLQKISRLRFTPTYTSIPLAISELVSGSAPCRLLTLENPGY
jgi:hypothetical protein